MPLNQIPKIVATVARVSGASDHFWSTVVDCIIPHVGTGIVWVAAAVTESDPTMIMAGALTGGIAMGWAFAAAAETGSRAQVFKRCGIHGCLGIFWGIFLAYHYGGPDGPFPHVPLWAISALTAGLSGAVMVAILPTLPATIRELLRWAKRRFLGIESAPKHRIPDVPHKPRPKKDLPGDETQRIE